MNADDAAAGRTTAPDAYRPPALDHIALDVRSLDEVLHLLVDVLGLTVTRRLDAGADHPAIAWVDAGAVQIELMERADGGDRAGARLAHVALDVGDLEATCAALAGDGVEFTTAEPARSGTRRSLWSEPASSAGFPLQLVHRGAP